MMGRAQCLAPLATALIAAPEALFSENNGNLAELLEAWWTLVVYHGSIKGVGRSHNTFETDVEKRLSRLNRELSHEKHQNAITRKRLNIAQLTSQSSAEKNAETFSQLSQRREDPKCLDVALATNMISVGLDIGRLASMIINGQPLTTGEYIQSSSRVGRDSVPGLVFTNYYRDQARSLSHYEGFKAYHESFYRFVEPTSITPFTYQARLKALHAALVISIRHAVPNMLDNMSAGSFNPEDEKTQKVIECLKSQCRLRCLDDEHLSNQVNLHINSLMEEWNNAKKLSIETKRNLAYSQPDNTNNCNRLLFNHFDNIRGVWPTLQSMRNVEPSSLIKQL
jgi:superfamily II DNA/RNA helicase